MKNNFLSFLFLLFFSASAFSENACNTKNFQSFDGFDDSFLNSIIDKAKPKLQYKGFVSPSDLRKYDVNTIAELLIDRIEEGCDKVRGGDEPKSIGEESQVMMMVNDKLFDSIDKYGFQNQHVTSTTEGCSCREKRYSAETTMIATNVGYSSKSKDILPKYSGLNVLNKNHYSSSDNGALGYGNVAVVFKKDINSRVTFTPWDSLGVRKFKDSPILSSMSFKGNSKKGFECENYTYCEAQVWGELGFENIDYVLIPVGHKVPEKLKQRGVPVFFVQENNNGSMNWEKGDSAYKVNTDRNLSKELITSKCDGCGNITKKINDHHTFSTLETDKLLDLKDSLESIDQRREVLGELIQRDFKGKQDLFENLLDGSDTLKSSIAMQALSEFPNSKKLKQTVLSYLKSSPYLSGYSSRIDSDLLMAISIASELKEFSNDQSIQKELANFLKRVDNNYINQYYQYLTTDKNICEEYKVSKK